jgi:fimbrial isopeptide formation D2 family protein/uncharacterized repeat protein (TIGR01451 family)
MLLTTTLLDPTGNNWGFGSGLSISPDWTVVGSPRADDQGFSQTGLAYVFDSDGTLRQTLHNPAPGNGDWFGYSTAVEGNTVAVGAVSDNSSTGSVYVFDASTGGLLYSIANPRAAAGEDFGISVSLSGNLLVVGADFANGSGGAYVYEMSTGGLVTTLNNPAASPHDRYGTDVAISGNIAVVGSYGEDALAPDAGAAYVFDATNGNLLQTLNHPDPHGHDVFGISVAVAGNVVVVGATDYHADGVGVGRAYAFDASNGNLVATLINPTPSPNDNFGSVAISGNTAVVGAYGDDSNRGAVYVFDARTGALTDTLRQPNPQPNDFFGGVAISGNRLAISAGGVDTAGTDSGAVFEYLVQSRPLDFGDAPDVHNLTKPASGTNPPDYITRLSDDGPRHAPGDTLRLGMLVDVESDALPNVPANGDDKTNTGSTDDEDGVPYLSQFNVSAGNSPKVPVLVSNLAAGGPPATLYGWIDYDRDGVFDNGTERASISVPPSTNNAPMKLVFPVVPSWVAGQTYARFRLSNDPAAANSTGFAWDGEVEDYRVTIGSPGDGTVLPGPTGLPMVVKISDTQGGLSPGNGGGVLHDYEFFGRVAALGDFDHDGNDDLVVGANKNSDGGPSRGAVYLVYLNSDGTVKGHDKISEWSGNLTPNNAGGLLPDYAAFGSSVATVGDIDGDGVDDLAVGAYNQSDGGPARGAVYVLFLNADGTVNHSQKISSTAGGLPPGTIHDYDIFGFAVAPLGDMNADGVPDLAVSAVYDEDGGPNHGAVYLLRLNRDGTVQSSSKISDLAGDLSPGNTGGALQDQGYFGLSVAALGDVNGDGMDDLAVGSVDSDGGPNRGAMRVLFLTADGTVLGSQRISDTSGGLSPGNRGGGLRDGDEFGRAAAPLGDFDGDGVPDLAVELYGDEGGLNRGAIEVLFLNSDGTVKRHQRISDKAGGLSPDNAGGTLGDGARFGSRGIARINDLNGDGVPELAASSADDNDGGPNRGAAYVLFMNPAAPACRMTPPRDTGASLQQDARVLFDGEDLQGNDGPCAAIGLELITVGLEFAFHEANSPATPFHSGHPLLQSDGSRVIVDAIAKDAVGSLAADLEALGMQIFGTFEQLVSGWLPLGALDELANLDSLLFAKPAYAPITNTHTGPNQLADSQGDPAMKADVTRTTYLLDGTGITVGVLSDSFDNFNPSLPPPSTTASADVINGDLRPVSILNDPFKATDEGRGMMQIIHDVAPGASGLFATAFGGELLFSQNIRRLAAHGADIIVDDISVASEPMFLDGIVAQAVDDVVAGGVAYFSSAGNSDSKSYEAHSYLKPSNAVAGPNGGFLHDFDSGTNDDVFQQVTIPVGNRVILSFQWDQTFASLGCDGAETDLNLLLYDNKQAPKQVPLNTPSLGNLLTYTYTNSLINNIEKDPIEVLVFINDGSIDLDGDSVPDTTFNLAIELVKGPVPSVIKYADITASLMTIDDFPTYSPTTFGHANAAGAITVGAADYHNYPGNSFGNTPALEGFSALGGVPILFDTTGSICCNRLPNPVTRNTPDIVGPDGVDTSFFPVGSLSTTDTDGTNYPNFFGTSAAAPHAAAVAALLLDAGGGAGSLSPQQIEYLLEDTAINFPVFGEQPSGYDFQSGFGFIDANAAVTKLLGSGGGSAPATPVVTLDVPGGALINQTFDITATFDNGSSTQMGWGPFVDFVLQYRGTDGVFPFSIGNEADGIGALANSVQVLDASGTPLPIIVTPIIGPTGKVAHPFAKDSSSSSTPLMVKGNPGDLLVSVRLPFGSFAPNQPPTQVTLKPFLSDWADLGTPLYVRARGGFEYGYLDPTTTSQGGLDNAYVVDPEDSSRWTEQFVTPELIHITKSSNTVDGYSETATGPNYPRTWTITVDVADGQTITNLDIIDLLPNNVYVLSASASPVPAPPIPPTNSATLTWTIPAITGTIGSADAVFTVTFYIPDKDANGYPILDPVTGAARLIENNVKAVGDWTPNDPRDTPLVHSVLANPCCPDNLFYARSLAIQKSATLVTDLGKAGPTPGDIVEYTLTFQVSDYFGFQNILVDDYYSDGQHLIGVPELNSVPFGPGNSSASIFLFPTACSHCPANSVTPFENSISFNVSAELILRGVPGGQLLGGLFPNPSGSNNGPAGGVITFRTEIQDAYDAFNASGELFLDEHDELSNCVGIAGDVLDPNTLLPNGHVVVDGSQVELQVPVGDFLKEIVALNDVPISSTPVLVAPKDRVTYRLIYKLSTGDYENLRFTDYAPDPLFGTATYTWLPSPLPPPQAAGFYYSELDGNAFPPNSVTTDAVNNTVTFDFGTRTDPSNIVHTLVIYYTLEATCDPYADGLLLTNQGVAEHQDTHLHPIFATDTEQVQSAWPELHITKGVVATNEPDGVFSPAIVGPVAFAAPATANPRFPAFGINSSGLAASPIDSDLSNVDPGSCVTFAIVVENTGHSPYGAFDVIVKDTLPSGYKIPATGLNLSVTDGNGFPLAYTLLTGGLFGNGIELNDGTTYGSLGPYTATGGTNIVVITFDLCVMEGWEPKSLLVNTASLTNYSGQEGCPDYTPIDLTDDAAVTTPLPTIDKKIIATDQAFTTGTNVAIGEVVTYEVTITIPHGTSYDVKFTDLLGPGEALTSLATLSSNYLVSAGLSTSVVGSWPAAFASATLLSPPNGTSFEISFGTVTNSDTNLSTLEKVTFRYDAVVLNVAGNQGGTLLTNKAQWTWQPCSPEVQTIAANTNPFAGWSITFQGQTIVLNPVLATQAALQAALESLAGIGVGNVQVAGEPGGPWVVTFVGWFCGQDVPLLDIKQIDIVDIPVAVTETSQGGQVLPRCKIEDSEKVRVLVPNLFVEKLADVQAADAGDIVNYTIFVVNTGQFTTDAFEVSLADLLPPCLTLDTTSVVVTGVSGANVLASGGQLTITWAQIPSGQQAKITFSAVVDACVTPGQELCNHAELTWTTLPGSPSPKSLYNALSVERTSNPSDPGGAVNDLVADAEFCLTVPGPVPIKRIVATSEPSTPDNQVTIGEIVRYQLQVELPEGTYPNFALQDVLPSFLLWMGPVTVTTVSAWSFTVSPPLSSGNVKFDFGTIVNSDNDPDKEYLVVEFNALVTNTAANNAGDIKPNQFQVIFGDDPVSPPSVFTSNVVAVAIVEPRLEVDKAAHVFTDATGYHVTYTVTIKNSGTSTAFDATFHDPLYNGPAPSFELSPGGDTLTIAYTISARACDDIFNVVEVTGSSLPGTHGTFPNPTGTQTPGNPGDYNGERVYTAQDSVQLTELGGPCGVLCGVKWLDLNGDGVRQLPNEKGIGGVTIFADEDGDGILDDNESFVITRFDDPDTPQDEGGEYCLKLPAGTYQIREVVTAGYHGPTNLPQNAPFYTLDWAPPFPHLFLEFGNAPSGVGNFYSNSICGIKFDDLNGDGERQYGESLMADVQFELYVDQNPTDGIPDTNTPVATATTDADGKYCFTNLGPGKYLVREKAIPGVPQTSANPPTLDLTHSGSVFVAYAGQAGTLDMWHTEHVERRLAFGNDYPERGKIHVCKFLDVDGDGWWDQNEPSLPGVAFELYVLVGGTPYLVATKTTGLDGGVTFAGLLPGTYRLKEVSPGTIITTPPIPDIVLGPGEVISFGGCPLPGSVSGLKWADINGNRTHEWTEPGIAGVRIYADLDGDGTYDAGVEPFTFTMADDPSTLADETGLYWLDDLPPGTYKIREVVPTGRFQTYPTTGFHQVVMTAGSSIGQQDFGNRRCRWWACDVVVFDPAGDVSLTPIVTNVPNGSNWGTPVLELMGSFLANPDPAEPLGVAVIGVNDAQGLWQFSVDGGASWDAIAGVSPALALVLGAGPSDRVRFVPAQGFHGTVGPGLTYRGWDRSAGPASGTAGVDASQGGGELPFTIEIGTASIDVLDQPPVARLSLRVTDAAGQPLQTLTVGRPFVLEVYTEDTRPVPKGVFAAYLDVLFDSTLVSLAGPISFGGQYPNGHSGSTATAGLLNEVGAFADANQLGGGPFRLFSVPLTAVATGQVDFFANQAEAANHAILLYGGAAPTPPQDVAFAGTSLLIVFSPWRNPGNPFDVSGDGQLSALDALLVINEINGRFYSNANQELPVPPPVGVPPPYLDATGDNLVTPQDVLVIVNELNRQPATGGEGEAAAFLPPLDAMSWPTVSPAGPDAGLATGQRGAAWPPSIVEGLRPRGMDTPPESAAARLRRLPRETFSRQGRQAPADVPPESVWEDLPAGLTAELEEILAAIAGHVLTTVSA